MYHPRRNFKTLVSFVVLRALCVPIYFVARCDTKYTKRCMNRYKRIVNQKIKTYQNEDHLSSHN